MPRVLHKKNKINYTVRVPRHLKMVTQPRGIFLNNISLEGPNRFFFFTGDKTKSDLYYRGKGLLTLINMQKL